jgi:hypothetical protein
MKLLSKVMITALVLMGSVFAHADEIPMGQKLMEGAKGSSAQNCVQNLVQSVVTRASTLSDLRVTSVRNNTFSYSYTFEAEGSDGHKFTGAIEMDRSLPNQFMKEEDGSVYCVTYTYCNRSEGPMSLAVFDYGTNVLNSLNCDL